MRWLQLLPLVQGLWGCLSSSPSRFPSTGCPSFSCWVSRCNCQKTIYCAPLWSAAPDGVGVLLVHLKGNAIVANLEWLSTLILSIFPILCFISWDQYRPPSHNQLSRSSCWSSSSSSGWRWPEWTGRVLLLDVLFLITIAVRIIINFIVILILSRCRFAGSFQALTTLFLVGHPVSHNHCHHRHHHLEDEDDLSGQVGSSC